MKKKSIYLLLLAGLLAGLLATGARAGSSEHFRLDWLEPLTSGGGGSPASENYAASITIGQAAAGAGDSAAYRVNLGFWQEDLVESERFVWIPAVMK